MKKTDKTSSYLNTSLRTTSNLTAQDIFKANLGSETHELPMGVLDHTLRLETCQITFIQGESNQGESFFHFSKDIIRIGAHPRCDIQVSDGTVSRFHCEIHRDQDGYRLVDGGSTNGTFVGELRIRDVYLGASNQFQIGNSILQFSLEIKEINLEESSLDQLGPLIGRSKPMRNAYYLIQKVAPSDLSVVIHGETGTGKELAAQALHSLSRRKDRELIVFDCSAVPEHLIESELFGHEKGAFSGAIRKHIGLFEQADGGTLFLDELGELPVKLQPKLLRALENGVIRRVGGEKTIRVDVRVLSATNRDLSQMVKEGEFRQDLFYRLAKVQLILPPLRQREGDVTLISQHFIKRLNQQNEGFRYIRGLSTNAIKYLESLTWPGNVRELRNVIERAYTFADKDIIQSADLKDQIDAQNLGDTDESYMGTELNDGAVMNQAPFVNIPESCSLKEAKELIIESFEKDYLIQLLQKHNQNISAVSREAGIDRRHVYRLMKKYQIEP